MYVQENGLVPIVEPEVTLGPGGKQFYLLDTSSMHAFKVV